MKSNPSVLHQNIYSASMPRPHLQHRLSGDPRLKLVSMERHLLHPSFHTQCYQCLPTINSIISPFPRPPSSHDHPTVQPCRKATETFPTSARQLPVISLLPTSGSRRDLDTRDWGVRTTFTCPEPKLKAHPSWTGYKRSLDNPSTTNGLNTSFAEPTRPN